MTSAGLEIRELEPGEGARLREVRLRALSDSPDAFTSSYQDEAALDEDAWETALGSAHWLVAEDRGEDIGVVGLVHGSPPPGARYVESTWVAPSHRRQGVLRSLVGRLVEMGREAHLESLFLWVVHDNEVAGTAYRQLGFVPTGHEQRLDGNGRYERRLRLDVDA